MEHPVRLARVPFRLGTIPLALLLACAPLTTLAGGRDVPGGSRRAASDDASATETVEARRTLVTDMTDAGDATRTPVVSSPIDSGKGGFSVPEPTGRRDLNAKITPPNLAPLVMERPASGEIPLSLQTAVELALAHHLDLQGSLIDRASAQARVRQQRGAFDPVLSGFYQHSRQVQPSPSSLQASIGVDTTDYYRTGMTHKLSYGATYEVTMEGRRSETNNPFVVLSPSYTMDFTLKYTQPLLRGFGRDANRAALAQALNSASIARLDVQMRARDVARDAIRGYWELVFAIRDLQVRRASLGLAQELLRKNKIMVEVGTLAPLEIAQAEASVAEREFRIIGAVNAVGAAEDNLRRLLGVVENSDWWSARIVPKDDPVFSAVSAGLEDSLRAAMERRSEMESATLALASARLAVAQAKDSLLPQLNLEAEWSANGLAFKLGDMDPLVDSDGDGDPTNDNDEVRPGDWDEAKDAVTTHDYEGWRASLTWSQPLRNRAAEGDYLVRRLALEDARINQARTRQTVILEVRRAVRDLDSARESVASATVSRQLQEKKLDAEIKKFENGLSTNFEVLQFQTDLQTAESTELRALTDYLQAMAELGRARGTLLRDYGLAPPR